MFVSSTETQEISARTGKLWECQSRRPFLNGFVYLLKLRDQFDDLTPHEDLEERAKAASEVYERSLPFFEPMGSFLSNEPLNKLYAHRFAVLKPFGYRQWSDASGVFMELPDKEAIEAQWEEIRKARLGLRKLAIISIESEEGDIPFIEAFFTHDAFLSRKHLFVHDHINHTMQQLEFLLEGDSESQKEMKKVKEFVGKIYKRIQLGKQAGLNIEFPRIENFLASFIDSVAMSSDKSDLSWICNTGLSGYIEGIDLSSSNPPIRPLWNTLVENEKKLSSRA